MSRRRGEFEHRTSIFEGAFRAWSHLGGLEPIDLETKPASELDPLQNPIPNDPRLAAQKEKDRLKSNKSPTSGDSEKKSSSGREYPYEPLPRSGLVHPFVQAILSPWLGPDADQDAIQLGLTTLRTWWQHRRKGESGSAIVALGTEKMQGVVDGYTRHFFNLAHCLVVNDKEQPPRTLQGKMKEVEKANNRKKKRGREDNVGGGMEGNAAKIAMGIQGMGPMSGGLMNVQSLGDGNTAMNAAPGLLDRLQASQRRLLAAEGGVSSLMPGNNGGGIGSITSGNEIPKNTYPMLELKGRCIGKVDLPGLVQKVNSAATQLAHRGLASSLPPKLNPPVDPSKYGDPNITPLLLKSSSGDLQFLMTVDGITCAHCVKIVETVLKGAPGRAGGSPIQGLLDAAADQEMNAIVIKIGNATDARRIAHESARNLSMVGYTACAKSVNIGDMSGMTLGKMERVFEAVAGVDPAVGNVLDWGLECRCPDNNVARTNCPMHQQMSRHIFESFDKAAKLVSELVAGCGKKYGTPCTAGNHCFCKSTNDTAQQQPQHQVTQLNDMPDTTSANLIGVEDTQPIRDGTGRSGRMSMRMSLGGLLGRHSLTSNTTFGRAMSGLSALSIDWENMDDFDINVDHSEGINNDIVNQQKEQQQQSGDIGAAAGAKLSDGEQQRPRQDSEDGYGPIQRVGPRTARRSSLRNPMTNSASNGNMNVSFDM